MKQRLKPLPNLLVCFSKFAERSRLRGNPDRGEQIQILACASARRSSQAMIAIGQKPQRLNAG
jgi:hypothetical protein